MPPSTKQQPQISSSNQPQPVNGIDAEGQKFLDEELQGWIEEATPGAEHAPTPSAPVETRQRDGQGRFAPPAELEQRPPLERDPLSLSDDERPPGAVDDDEPAEPQKRGKDENMARMRQGLEERDTRIQSLEARLAEFEEAELRASAAEEEAQIYKQQIEELSEQLEQHRGYRTIVDLQSDPEYREQYVEPMIRLKNDLLETADAYEVDRAVIDQALLIKSVPQLERFLTQHFNSTIAINRVMESVAELQQVATRKAHADLQPQELYVRMREAKKVKELNDAERQEKDLKRMAEVGWEESVDYYRENEIVAPFVRKEPGNIRQNRMVDAIMEDAQALHSSVVESLRKNGLRELPYNLSQRLSAMPIKAVAFDMLAKQVADLRKELRERDKQIEELNSYKRPNGSNSFRGGAPAANEPAAAVGGDSFFDALIEDAREQVEGNRR